ncbi:MAG TPA: branched-chain amino acid ABC transporter substrate-binding protein [Candidatus Eremiobacteraceae bacterium]|nr:branched-chain amino acid ABC transporter substrate-binding protein [Candidatus Eremiobacteraceae bacterium]
MRHVFLRRLAAAALAAFAAGLVKGPALADFPPYAKVVGIALVAPLSGDQKAYGLQLSNGMNLAIDLWNEKRNLADFGYVFHSFDDQGDPGVAQQQADFSMVDPQTAVVVGHVGAEETFLSLPIYHEKDMPLIIPTSPLAQLTRTGDENVFRLCPTDIVEGQQAARYAERTLHAKKAAVLYEQTDYGIDAGGGFVDYASAGKQLAAKDFSVQADLKNVKAVVADVVAYAPDVVYLTGNGADMGTVLAALRTAGVTAPVLGTQALYDDRAVKAAGPAAESLIVSSCVPPIQFVPSATLFVREYQAHYGRVTSFALMGYVAAQIAIGASQQAHSGDKLAIMRQLQIGSFQTILGSYSFVRGGDVANPILYFYQYGGGEFKYLNSSYPNPLVTR